MPDKKKAPNDLQTNYKRTLEASFVIALLVLCSLFFAFQKHESTFELPFAKIPETKIEVIPLIKQPPPMPPKPPTPIIPVESDDPDLESNTTIEQLTPENIGFVIRPPEPEIDETFEFWAVSVKPEIKHKAIPYYPELARKANIQGLVHVEVTISKTGQVIDAFVKAGIPMLNEAALDAARRCTFFPAMQRDKYVKVKMVIPFDFRLN